MNINLNIRNKAKYNFNAPINVDRINENLPKKLSRTLALLAKNGFVI